MNILVKILIDSLGVLASTATLYETGKGVYADIKKQQKTSEYSLLKVTTDNLIVERVIDRARQALTDMGSLEVISIREREEILSAVSDIQGMGYEEREEAKKQINELITRMNQYITDQMTMDGKILYKAEKEYADRTEASLEKIIELLRQCVDSVPKKTYLPCENQNEEYIAEIREELQDKVAEDYIQRYVGKAEEIIGKDERYLNVVKPLRKTLYDVVNEEKRVVLLGQAGAGKTTELEKLAQVLCKQNTPPVFISLNTYSNETIEELITQWISDYKIENSVLVLDGYDEIADINSFHRKLDSYVRKHPDQKIVISTRNNFYHLSREKRQEGSLNQFKEYAIFPILSEDISEYLRKSGVDETIFWKQVQMRKLTEQLKIPFFLIHLVEIFKEEGSLPELKELMPRLIRVSMNRDMLKFEQKEELEIKERQIRIILQRIGMTMQLMKTKQLTESELQEIVTEEENKLIRFSGIWKKMPDGSWQFTHNNFKEYVTAECLVSFPVEKILELVTYEKNRDRIKESWYNVLSFASLLDTTGRINTWILEHDPSILFQYEDERMSMEDKQKLFISIFEKINNDYTWISWRNDMDVMVHMAHNPLSISYLLDSIENPKHDRCRDNAAILLMQMEDYCGYERRVRFVFTELIFDESATLYVRKNLLEILAMGGLYTEQVEHEIFEHFADIEGLPEDIIYGLLMFINYSQRNNAYVPFLLKCLVKCNRRREHYAIEYTAEALLGALTGYRAVHELLTLIVEMPENKKSELIYYISGVFEKLEEQIGYIYEKEETAILEDTEKIFDVAALTYDERTMQTILHFWKKENLLEQENQRIVSSYSDDTILHIFQSFVYPEDNTKLEERAKQIREKQEREQKNYFDALFDKKKYQKIIEDFVEIMGDEVTYRKIRWSQVYHRTKREDLRELSYIMCNVEFQDDKVKDFTEIVDWENFSIGEICRHIKKQKIDLSDQQLRYIEDYVQKQVPAIQWDKELCSDKKGTTTHTWRLEYVCYFIIRFDIDVPNEFIKHMILLSSFFGHEENQRSEDGKTDNLDGYICSRLSEHEIVMQLKKIAKEQILYGSMAERYIEWCEKYKTDAGMEIAERILEDRECNQYDRKQCFTYLQKIMTGEHLVDKYLEKADAELLDVFAEKAAELNTVKVNERLLEATAKSEGKTKYLRTLLNVYPEKALPLYYEIASERNGIPDYNGKNTIAGITKEIAELDNPAYVDILMKLLELCFRDGFVDGEFFGLYDSVYKALLNIASGAAEVVLEKLGNLRDQTDNKKVKGCCNNMILNIEKQYYEQLDVPWTMQKIKQLNSQWNMV